MHGLLSKKKKKKPLGTRSGEETVKPHKHWHLSTKEWKSIKRTHLSKGKDSTYLFSHLSLIIKMKSSSKKGLQIDVGKNKSLVLLLCSAFTRHLYLCCKWTNEESLEAAFRNSRQNRENTGARIQSFIVPSECDSTLSDLIVRSLSAKYRPDRYRRDKSVKFGTELP